MHRSFSQSQACLLTSPLLRNALHYPHRSASKEFDAFCLPHDPDVPYNRLYKEELPSETALLKRIGDVLAELDVARAYIPYVASFNARIGSRCELRQPIATPAGITLYRSLDPSTRMDGTDIEPGEAVVFALGGCGVSIGGKSVAHTGRDSLIDRRALTGNPTRAHASVVDAIAERTRNQGMVLEHERFVMLFGLPAESFGHELEGPDGKLWYAVYSHTKPMDHAVSDIKTDKETGKQQLIIDIGRLAAVQAHRAGFRSSKDACTLPFNKAFGYTRHGAEDMRDKRNLTIVVRRK